MPCPDIICWLLGILTATVAEFLFLTSLTKLLNQFWFHMDFCSCIREPFVHHFLSIFSTFLGLDTEVFSEVGKVD